ncbi:MAG: hypothetical protein JRJ60_21280, partial [Deltaproteobacteria bacterium]|nr:hypothetical protein [Deltaproteobacteria bacterium]
MIPPGGTGRIHVEIDSRRLRGPFEKTVSVRCDDPVRGNVRLRLEGEVKLLAAFEPGGYVSLQGPLGKVPKEGLLLVNYHEKPLRITRIRSDLEDRIQWQIQERKAGREFILMIQDRSQAPGEYTGRLILETDNP